MISCPTIQKNTIRRHYDVSTLFYRLLWGQHIHHGYWEANESPTVAQNQLIDRLAEAAAISPGQSIVDIGCGMGGSSRRLAAKHACHVTGVTISGVQRRWATLAALTSGQSRRLHFLRGDAEQIDFDRHRFDTVWSIECTEHLFDKPAFIARAAEWLKPGGRMAICAWLAGPDLDDAQKQLVYDVCEGFFCPSLATSDEYKQWMQDAGLVVERADDWTRQVERTWEICRDRVQRFAMRRAATWIDRQQVIFIDRFQTLLDAYRSGAMQYGCLVSRKPPD